jgi:hypothetical protein
LHASLLDLSPWLPNAWDVSVSPNDVLLDGRIMLSWIELAVAKPSSMDWDSVSYWVRPFLTVLVGLPSCVSPCPTNALWVRHLHILTFCERRQRIGHHSKGR